MTYPPQGPYQPQYPQPPQKKPQTPIERWVRRLWGSGRNGKIAIVGTVVFLLLCCSLTGRQMNENSNATATAVSLQQQQLAFAAATQAALPTATLKPTHTPTATSTPTPTDTPLPTPEPATRTAQAELDAQATAVVVGTQTAGPAATEVAAIEATQTRKVNQTATIVALADNYNEVDVRALKKNPDKFFGQPIWFEGEVLTIEESAGSTYMQLWVRIPGGTRFDREAVVVTYEGTLDEVYEESVITVYGVGRGTFEGKNAMGGDIIQPMIKAEYVRW